MAGKIQKKHFKSLAVIIAATVLIVIGSTMAFFTSSDETTNKFIGSRFDIVLFETKWDPEKAKDVVPGDELDKNPQVYNAERTSGYVYLRVTVPCDSQMVDNDDGTAKGTVGDGVPMYKFMVAHGTDPQTYAVNTEFSPKQAANSDWQLVTIDNPNYTRYDREKQQYIYVYAYASGGELTMLRKGDLTTPLFDKIRLWNFNEDFDPEKSHNVLVEAFGIQADLTGYTPDQIPEIWAVLEGEDGG